VDVESDSLLWSERYDREMQDVFEVQDEIARKIAAALRVTLSPQEQEAIAVKPHRAASYRLLGNALLSQGLLGEAEGAYREALRLRPDDGQSRFNLWTVLEKQGKHADCELAYRDAIRLKPDHAEAYARLGQALGRQGRWDEAQAACQEAVRLSPDDPRFRNTLQAVSRRRP
jgi:cytochrome c-type biogenesis protein CcmH/NrfG